MPDLFAVLAEHLNNRPNFDEVSANEGSEWRRHFVVILASMGFVSWHKVRAALEKAYDEAIHV